MTDCGEGTSATTPAAGPPRAAPTATATPEAPARTPSSPSSRATGVRRLVRGGTMAVLLAVAVQSLGNLVFHALAGRGMPQDQYGALGALLAVMTLLAVPLSGLQTAVSAAVATREGHLTPGSLQRLVGMPTLVALVPAAGLLLAAGPVADWLRLEGPGGAALLAPTLVVAVALACLRGMLLGAGAPLPVAAGFVASVGVRLLAVLLVPTLYGAVLGTLAGELAAAAVAAAAARARTVPGRAVVLGRLRVALGVTSLLALFLFTTGDLLLARHHLDPAASGAYVAAATVAKTALALPAAALSVLFPRLVTAWSGRGPDGPAVTLRRVGGAVVALAAVGSGALVLAPELFLGLLFHDVYADAAPLLRVLALTALLSCVVTVAVNSAIARGSAGAVVVPAAGALLQLVLVTAWHDDALAIAWASAAAAVATSALAVAVEGAALVRSGRDGSTGRAKPAQTLRRA